MRQKEPKTVLQEHRLTPTMVEELLHLDKVCSRAGSASHRSFGAAQGLLSRGLVERSTNIVIGMEYATATYEQEQSYPVDRPFRRHTWFVTNLGSHVADKLRVKTPC